DDLGMMREVIERRFRRGLQEQAGEVEERGFAEFPDLVVIDGGKGQLNAAREVMRELGVADIPTISLAEGSNWNLAPGADRDRERTVERVFVQDRHHPVPVPWASPGLKRMQGV